MNMLFVLSLGFDRPGPSVHLLTDLMEALAKRGHTITVLQQNTGGPGEELPPVLRNTGRVRARTIPMAAAAKDNFAARYLARRRYARLAGRRMEGKFDLVYIHSCQNLNDFVRLARRRCPGAKVVVNVQDIFPQNAAAIGLMGPGNPLYRFFYGAQARAYRGADAIITLSPDMKRTLIQAGAAGNKVAVIPPWTYSDAIGPVPQEENAFLERYPEVRDYFRVVYAGNVGQMQNVDVLLEAARQLGGEERILLMVVGGGVRAGALEERAQDVPNLRFYPMQPSEMAAHVYSMAHVNLITLAKGVTATAFPSKTAICCAVGRPILAAVDPDSQYGAMIGRLEGCGVVPPGDGAALAGWVRRACRPGQPALCPDAQALYHKKLSRAGGLAAHIRLLEGLGGGGCK